MANRSGRDLGAAVASNVRAELARRGVRQTQAAEVLGITQSGVSSRLRGRIEFSAAELVSLAEWLDVAPARFFDALPEPKQPEQVAS